MVKAKKCLQLQRMNIIGINGLGISPSACLLVDGKMTAFAEEERFNRFKGTIGVMPTQATEFCLKQAGLQLKDIDKIAFGWDANLYKAFMPIFFARKFISRSSGASAGAGASRVAQELLKYRPGNVAQKISEMFKSVGQTGPLPPVSYHSHHASHAASSFFCSGFDESIIAVFDGSGEHVCTSIFLGKGTEITLLEQYEIPDSLGWFYQAMTEYLGFRPNSHEGKLMALAAYGHEDATIKKKLESILTLEKGGRYRHQAHYSFMGSHTKSGNVFSDALVELLGKPRNPDKPISEYEQQVAFCTQQVLEEAVMHLLDKHLNASSFSGNICLAGGVALNCKMNGVVAQHPKVKNIYIPPHCGDTGTALGAALLALKATGANPRQVMTHAYYGPEIKNNEVADLLKKTGVRYRHESDIPSMAAQLLMDNKIIAWCQGRMEIGQRALGNRSILAHPGYVQNRDTINIEIKNREKWRPFAASMLEELQESYLWSSKPSPFMTLAFHVTKLFQEIAPAAIHIDGTTRPQTVKKEDNPLYWQLIRSFGDQSGVYAVLNTSYNLKEEPIVCSAGDALRSFYSSSLDYLVLGDFILEK
jgi:carbamoyltransferase